MGTRKLSLTLQASLTGRILTGGIEGLFKPWRAEVCLTDTVIGGRFWERDWVELIWRWLKEKLLDIWVWQWNQCVVDTHWYGPVGCQEPVYGSLPLREYSSHHILQARYCSTHTESALPFYRRSYWGSPPLDQWCPRLPGLWIPPPFSLSPVEETDAPHEHSTQRPLGSGGTKKLWFDKHQSAFLFPLGTKIPPAFIIMSHDTQLPKCCRLVQETCVTIGTDKKSSGRLM